MLAPEPPACAGSADAGMPNAKAGAQFAVSGTAGIGPGLSLAGTVVLGLLLAALASSLRYLTVWVCHVASAVHCAWHWSTPDWSWVISASASATLPLEIVWEIVSWSLVPSWLTLRVDGVSRLERLIPATLWLVPRKIAT